MNEGAVLLILAYNEEGSIAVPLEYATRLKQNGTVREVLAVDDGSTDRTSEVAKSMGASVVRLEKNLGKGGAFLEGALWCKRNNADIVVMLDADMISEVNNPISMMLSDLHAKDKMDKPCMMVVAPASEGNSKPAHKFSGERAIKMAALNFLFVQKDDGWAFLSQSQPSASGRCLKGSGWSMRSTGRYGKATGSALQKHGSGSRAPSGKGKENSRWNLRTQAI